MRLCFAEVIYKVNHLSPASQQIFTISKSAIETEEGSKFV